VVTYQEPRDTADALWKRRSREWFLSSTVDRHIPRAVVTEIQSIDEFSSFHPMEVIATPEEIQQLVSAHADRKFLLFPEGRENPIRMTADLPQKWIQSGPLQELAGEARRGNTSLSRSDSTRAQPTSGCRVRFSDLRSPGGRSAIPASALRCINTGGINWDGAAFRKEVPVPQGRVQALWFGVQIPADAAPGLHRGSLLVEPRGLPPQSVSLAITVNPTPIPDSGDDEPWRHSRLRWLDSQLAADDGIVRPFTPVRVEQSKVLILGRRLTPGPSGLPAQMESFFSPEVTQIQKTPRPLLSARSSSWSKTRPAGACCGSVAFPCSERGTTGSQSGRLQARRVRSALTSAPPWNSTASCNTKSP